MQMSRKRKGSPADAPSDSTTQDKSAAKDPSKKKKKLSYNLIVSHKKRPVTDFLPKVSFPSARNKRPNKKKPQKNNKLFKEKESTSNKPQMNPAGQASRLPDSMNPGHSEGTAPVDTSTTVNEKKDPKKPGRKRKPRKKKTPTPESKQPVDENLPQTTTESTPDLSKKKGLECRNPGKPKIFLPKTAEEMSSNWKQMQSKDKKKKKKVLGSKLVKGKSQPSPTETSPEPEIWFDDVDDALIQTLKKSEDRSKMKTLSEDPRATHRPESGENNSLVREDSFPGITKCVAMDCEMVGVGDGTDSILARVSIVNNFGNPIYDKFVKPREKVVDYRTIVSGIRPENLVNAEEFGKVQKEVSEILSGRVLVGHALHNDMKVLYLSHPKRDMRDSSRYKPFRQICGGKTPSLKKLTEKLLGVQVQKGEHSSVEDAQAAMRLYTMHKKDWEKYTKDQLSKKGWGKKSAPKVSRTKSSLPP